MTETTKRVLSKATKTQVTMDFGPKVVRTTSGLEVMIRRLSSGERDEYEIHQFNAPELKQSYVDDKGKKNQYIDFRPANLYAFRTSVIDPVSGEPVYDDSKEDEALIRQLDPSDWNELLKEIKEYSGISAKSEETAAKNSEAAPA